MTRPTVLRATGPLVEHGAENGGRVLAPPAITGVGRSAVRGSGRPGDRISARIALSAAHCRRAPAGA